MMKMKTPKNWKKASEKIDEAEFVSPEEEWMTKDLLQVIEALRRMGFIVTPKYSK
jgi:hypothetical protein